MTMSPNAPITALHTACSEGCADTVHVLLGAHHVPVPGSTTPLMKAVQHGHVSCVQLLLSHSANVNALTYNQQTALGYACCGGDVACVQALLMAGAIVRREDLIRACESTRPFKSPFFKNVSVTAALACIHALLAHTGPDAGRVLLNQVHVGRTVLHHACYSAPIVRALLDVGADVHACGNDGRSLVRMALEERNEEAARLFIEHGARIDTPENQIREPLLFLAVYDCFSTDFLDLLLKHDPRIHAERLSALFGFACRELSVDKVRWLLDHFGPGIAMESDALIDILYAKPSTDESRVEQQLHLMRLMLQYGAPVNGRYVLTPLEESFNRRSPMAARLLLAYGASTPRTRRIRSLGGKATRRELYFALYRRAVQLRSTIFYWHGLTSRLWMPTGPAAKRARMEFMDEFVQLSPADKTPAST